MEGDAVVALPPATVDGQALFGQKSSWPAGNCPPLSQSAGRAFAPDDKLQTQFLELPQARQTHAVLGLQPDGVWGYEHGVNDQQVAIGCLPLPATLRCDGPSLQGTDLTRLALERSRSACQAVDLLTGLVERYGQGAFPGCPPEAEHDSAFLVVDPTEAYAVETAGHHWVYQEIQEVRAMSQVRVIRQDWDRISHGLASHAIGKRWWSDDGSKLDFAGALGEGSAKQATALQRWGRATLLLMEQNGHSDPIFIRRVLANQSEEIRPGSDRSAGRGENTGFIASLGREPAHLPQIWWGFSTAHISLYLPVFLDGELPASLTKSAPQPGAHNLWLQVSRLSAQLERNTEKRALVRDSFVRLQARFDQESEEFITEATGLRQRDALSELQRQATLFMQYNVERAESVLADSLSEQPLVAIDS